MENYERSEMSPFSSLPEGCVANIISFTSTKDACRAAAVSPAFKSAAESDFVWERFLPPDYEEKISESNYPVIFSTKKELYLHLCDHGLLFHGGKRSFRLIKSSGKSCYMLCARHLHIIWGGTPIYWNWTSLPESRFAEVAELLNVCWFVIRGIFPTGLLSSNTNYAAYLVFKLSDDPYGLNVPFRATINYVGVEENVRTVYIVPPRDPLTARDVYVEPATRRDGWKEIELGEFFVAERDAFDVEIKLEQIEILNWKRGLIVEGIEVRPKE